MEKEPLTIICARCGGKATEKESLCPECAKVLLDGRCAWITSHKMNTREGKQTNRRGNERMEKEPFTIICAGCGGKATEMESLCPECAKVLLDGRCAWITSGKMNTREGKHGLAM